MLYSKLRALKEEEKNIINYVGVKWKLSKREQPAEPLDAAQYMYFINEMNPKSKGYLPSN